MRDHPLSVVALTGFLGSGKTTLLEQCLAQSPVPLEKSALVINDFGPVNIDALVLNRPHLQMLSLTGGCVCCTSYGELIDGLARLAESPELELVWMETSGLAEPDEILDHLTSPKLQGKIRIQHLVQVIDSAHYPGPWRLRALEEEQLRYADWIVLNKADLVAPEKLEELETKIRAVNPQAVLRHAARGKMELHGFWEYAESSALASLAAESVETDCGCRHAHEHTPEPVSAATLYFPLGKPIPRAEFEEFLRELPMGIYRAKGFVRFEEEPEALYTFQKVSDQQETLLLPVRTPPPPATGLVFIGPYIGEKWLRQRLASWEVPSTATRLNVLN